MPTINPLLLSSVQGFSIHKQMGTYGKFLIPLHVGGAFSHFFRGQTIFARVNPFGRPKF
jgi:hypothetical protein